MSRDGTTILNDLERHKKCFDLTQDRLAEDLAEAAAMGIYITMDYQVDPDGTPWQPLSEKYREWKEKNVPGMLMAELEGAMKTQEELKGSLEVYELGMVQTYGMSDQTQDEAEWFQEGNDRQPKREFYAFNDLAEKLVDEVFDKRFATMIR